jgi:mannosyltransferase OCH1-like enzyme
MIPKKIHYCWFGGKELPKLAKKCLESWKRYCPDYEIIRWDESTFDINSNQYVKEAYENKKYAFVTDYVRLYALYNFGGIYMDTDVEVLKPLDEFLENKAFSGFESDSSVLTGIMASEKETDIIKKLLDYYDNRSFVKSDGTLDLTTNTQTITAIFEKLGLNKNNQFQVIDDFSLYPSEYFCPIDCSTKKKNITNNTHTIHWFSGSWIPLKDKIKYKFLLILKKIIGDNNAKKIKKFVNSKNRTK